jgi:hypothetical protein
MTASRGAIVPVPRPGTVLLVVPDGEDRIGFVLRRRRAVPVAGCSLVGLAAGVDPAG